MIKGRAGHPQRTRSIIVAFFISVIAASLSLVSVVSTYAMPVEARTTEPWFAYTASIGWEFNARVNQGKFYANAVMPPEQLMRIRGPVEPPVFRRVLLSKFTDAIEVSMPYRFKSDRSANMKVKWTVDGMQVFPGIWQKPYPLVATKEFSVSGPEFSGTETFVIPIAKILQDQEENRLQYGVNAEPMEIHITPKLEVETEGLKEPVKVVATGEFLITLRSGTVEVDDVRAVKDEKNFAETKIVPITLSIFGLELKVALVRQVSLIALVFFVIGAVVLGISRRTKPDARTLLQKLGPNLISARAFELPGDAAMVEVRSAKELLQLQVQLERPVIRAGNVYYLQDGTTCYRLTVTGETPPE